MKKSILLSLASFSLLLVMPLTLIGCGAVNTPAAPTVLAPGFYTPLDQQLAQALGSIRAFDAQQVLNYAHATPAEQAKEQGPLNTLSQAVNTANLLYVAYHNSLAPGAATIAVTADQVQTAINSAGSAQASFVTATGIH